LQKELKGNLDEFRDAIKDKSLGRNWRMRALLDFYSTTQGSTALEHYLSLEERKFVVDRGDPILDSIIDLVYKYILLSNTTPFAHVLNHNNDILAFAKADPSDIKDWPRKYSAGSTNPAPTFGFVPGPAPISSPSVAFELPSMHNCVRLHVFATRPTIRVSSHHIYYDHTKLIKSAYLEGFNKDTWRNTRRQPAMLRKSKSMSLQMQKPMFARLTLTDFDSLVQGFSQTTTGRPV
jgi:hypothetical protein